MPKVTKRKERSQDKNNNQTYFHKNVKQTIPAKWGFFVFQNNSDYNQYNTAFYRFTIIHDKKRVYHQDTWCAYRLSTISKGTQDPYGR